MLGRKVDEYLFSFVKMSFVCTCDLTNDFSFLINQLLVLHYSNLMILF